MKAKRRRFNGAFKAKVALEALKEREPLAELSEKYEVHANMISKWKQEFIDRAGEIFDNPPPEKQKEKTIEQLYTKIGQLEMEREWLKKISGKAGL